LVRPARTSSRSYRASKGDPQSHNPIT
jgi:hypothetical protein